MKFFAVAALPAAFLASAGAQAEHLPPQTAAYSAHATVEIDGVRYNSIVIADHGRERRIVQTDFGPQTLVIDPAKGKAYLVQSAFGTFAIDLSSRATGIDLPRLYGSDAKILTHETISGEPVTKYHLTAKPALNTSFTGDVWATDDGILIKLEGTGAFHGHPSRIEMELSDLRRGDQNPASFDLPRGESVVDANPIVRQFLETGE